MGAPGFLPCLHGRGISVGVRAVRRAPWVAKLAAVVVLAARPLAAQDSTAVLRGVVMDTAGTRVPYALVRILPAGTERFTDARGAFVFTALPLGAYRVQARQVGYEPFGWGHRAIRAVWRECCSLMGRCAREGERVVGDG